MTIEPNQVVKHYLALDVGLRRTGVAFADSVSNIALPLDTIAHGSLEELAAQVHVLMRERSIDHVVIGMPLLPSGEEGAQATIVTSFIELLQLPPEHLTLLDERYSSGPKKGALYDDNARAACAILEVFMERNEGNEHS